MYFSLTCSGPKSLKVKRYQNLLTITVKFRQLFKTSKVTDRKFSFCFSAVPNSLTASVNEVNILHTELSDEGRGSSH